MNGSNTKRSTALSAWERKSTGNQGDPWNQHGCGGHRDADDECDVEGRRLAEGVVDVAGAVECLDGGVRRRERHDRRRQKGRTQETEPEQSRGQVSGQRLQALGNVAGVVDRDAGHVQGGR